jgi:hypothetical protein
MTNLTQIKNHILIANNNLLEQDKYRPNIKGFISAIIKPLQDIEDRLFELHQNSSLDYATSFYLDRIGAIIGEDRDYRNDTDYRLAIRIRIISNNGGGTPEEILTILSSIYKNSKVTYTECGEAFFQIQIKYDEKPLGINKLLSKLKPVGINVPTVAHLHSNACFGFAESNKETGELLYSTKNIRKLASTASGDNIKVTFGTFKANSSALSFGEIIIDISSLKLNDSDKYLVSKKKKLKLLRSYQEYKIIGGGAFAELITNE